MTMARRGLLADAQEKRSTNSQPSSSQQDRYLSKDLESNSLVVAHACAKVGKVAKPVFVDLEMRREPCRLQVYSSLEVARGMVISLNTMGISGEAVRCPVCHRFHVVESR